MNGENIVEKQSSFCGVAYRHEVKTGHPWASILKPPQKQWVVTYRYLLPTVLRSIPANGTGGRVMLCSTWRRDSPGGWFAGSCRKPWKPPMPGCLLLLPVVSRRQAGKCRSQRRSQGAECSQCAPDHTQSYHCFQVLFLASFQPEVNTDILLCCFLSWVDLFNF